MNFGQLNLKHFSFLLAIVSFSFNIKSQDVEKILNSPIVAASGGINFNEVTYFADDPSKKRDPFVYYINGNINLTALGTVSMPFTFSYSNQKVDYQTSLPFNRFSFTPTYKWATAYIGYASLSFSPYTVSGHEFFGFGCQLSPFSSFKFSMLVGRFKEAKEKDTSNLSLPAVYNRMGAGFKTEIVKEKFSLTVIMFKAYDEKNSINSTYLKDSIDPRPKDNFTFSLQGKTKLFDKLNLGLEYSMSAINEDTRTENNTQSSYIPKFLFTPKANASYYKQYKIEANYVNEIGSIGATYERVDPNYNTLGAYYFTNDFENITLNLSTSLFKRITISMNGGLQRDDLENQKTSSMDRFVFSTNIAVRATKNLSFNVSYSNFQTYSHIKPLLKDDTSRTQFDKSDTLKYTQINQTISFGINYALPSTKDRKQSVNFNLMYQQASNKQGDNAEIVGSRFYNTSGSYSLSYTPLNINFTASTNYNQSKAGESDSKVVGLNLSLNKSFFKNQVKSTLSSSFNNTYLNGADNGAIINTRLNNTYTLYKKHNFGLNMCVINNKTKQNYNDLTITFNYGYNFNADFSRKDKKFKVEANF